MRRLILLTTLLCAASPAVHAASTASAVAITKIQQAYATKFGAIPDEVNGTPVPGLYQVLAGSRIVYMDTSSTYLLEGPLVNLKTGQNLSDAKQQQRAEAILKAANRRDALHQKHGNGIRTLYTFEDPRCGFCQKMAPDLARLTNVTIYTFPLAFLGPVSAKQVASSWCAVDRVGAWNRLMANKAVPAQVDCDRLLVSRNAELARQLGVGGTPTLFFKDGSRVQGYADFVSIQRRLDAIK